jgi:arylsulfatase A-like enzyme
MKRRHFLQAIGSALVVSALPSCAPRTLKKPNIILCMTDDLGWGDVGFHGHPILKTPHLDGLAANGLQLDRFYAAAPVCSPTRGSCLTGRHPFRYGVFTANAGHMKPQELTLAEALKEIGYTTGHFGKWHLGTLTNTVRDSNRGGRVEGHYSPPWENGFDVCFSTEAKTPTCDPLLKPKGWTDQRWWNRIDDEQQAEQYNTFYWTGPETRATENLTGDDSRIIMDRAVPFIEHAIVEDKPFFAVIWFHAPHWPVVAEKRFRDQYADLDDFSQNHFGCITALDEQIGRLKTELATLGVENNTLFCFCSDNGPEGSIADGPRHGKGSAGPFRGRKRDLYEGGVRVPGIFSWPDKIKKHRKTEFPACTSDYMPTIFDILSIEPDGPKPIDGISLLPLIENRASGQREKPIGFQHRERLALIDDQYKIISYDEGHTFELYDILDDPFEKMDIAQHHADIVAKMKEQLYDWQRSCDASRSGADYPS